MNLTDEEKIIMDKLSRTIIPIICNTGLPPHVIFFFLQTLIVSFQQTIEMLSTPDLESAQGPSKETN
jgi:hypothetical protein